MSHSQGGWSSEWCHEMYLCFRLCRCRYCLHILLSEDSEWYMRYLLLRERLYVPYCWDREYSKEDSDYRQACHRWYMRLTWYMSGYIRRQDPSHSYRWCHSDHMLLYHFFFHLHMMVGHMMRHSSVLFLYWWGYTAMNICVSFHWEYLWILSQFMHHSIQCLLGRGEFFQNMFRNTVEFLFRMFYMW